MYSLNIGQRIAIIEMLRMYTTPDIEMLLELRRRAKTFEITDEEKEKVGLKKLPAIGGETVSWDDKEYVTELEIDELTSRVFNEQIKSMAQNKRLTANDEFTLSVYELLTARAAGSDIAEPAK